MRRAVRRSKSAGLLRAALAAALAVSLLSVASPPPAAAAAGRTVVVAPWGVDAGNLGNRPYRSIAMGIRHALPGDTILVRGGVYYENAGWGAVPGTADAPILLTAAAGERVVIAGTLTLKGADYWTVSRINVTYSSRVGRTESLVLFNGGHDWQFVGGEVWGSRGVSNLMVNSSTTYGVARNYRIAGNCIHSNMAKGDALLNDHNLYIQPGATSGPGLIERNIIFGAPNGGNIKAASGSTTVGTGNVLIRYNTMAAGKAGVIVGYGSNNIVMSRNLFAAPVGGTGGDAAIRLYHLYGARNYVVDSAMSGFKMLIRRWSDSRTTVAPYRNKVVRSTFNRQGVCVGYRPTDAASQAYGRFAA